jgi:polyisoprenoid-binding protein YceI
MSVSGELSTSAVQGLLQDGQLAGSWTLDAARSEVRLASRGMWGLVPVKGIFRQVSGHGSVSAAGDATGVITVAAGSIDTKNKKRDDHLRSADFLDAASHPDITFTVDGVTPGIGGAQVTGSLTVHDRTRPVSFDARVSSFDGAEISLDADVEVNRADYGLTSNPLGMASMNNTISIHAAFTRS